MKRKYGIKDGTIYINEEKPDPREKEEIKQWKADHELFVWLQRFVLGIQNRRKTSKGTPCVSNESRQIYLNFTNFVVKKVFDEDFQHLTGEVLYNGDRPDFHRWLRYLCENIHRDIFHTVSSILKGDQEIHIFPRGQSTKNKKCSKLSDPVLNMMSDLKTRLQDMGAKKLWRMRRSPKKETSGEDSDADADAVADSEEVAEMQRASVGMKRFESLSQRHLLQLENCSRD